jgi:hypothetical protein
VVENEMRELQIQLNVRLPTYAPSGSKNLVFTESKLCSLETFFPVQGQGKEVRHNLLFEIENFLAEIVSKGRKIGFGFYATHGNSESDKIANYRKLWKIRQFDVDTKNAKRIAEETFLSNGVIRYCGLAQFSENTLTGLASAIVNTTDFSAALFSDAELANPKELTMKLYTAGFDAGPHRKEEFGIPRDWLRFANCAAAEGLMCARIHFPENHTFPLTIYGRQNEITKLGKMLCK